MKLYITSSPTGTYLCWDQKEFDGFNTENDMVEELKKDLGNHVRCLMIAASPDEPGENDWMLQEMKERFEDSGFQVDDIRICDRRTMELSDHLEEFTIVILGGGHVPTQNQFFKEMNLKEKMADYQGVVMGISAGSMNMAELVYAQPELEGEAIDPNYQRFLPGLGLTKIQVLPHYNAVKDFYLDGKRIFEDITYADSYGNTFIAIVDGSYILVRDGQSILCGEGYRIRDGVLEKICEKSNKVRLA